MGYATIYMLKRFNEKHRDSRGGSGGYYDDGNPLGCAVTLIVVLIVCAIIFDMLSGAFFAEPTEPTATTEVSETAPEYDNLVFSDVTPEHWCYDKIVKFAEKGYVNGYEDGTFRPNQTITRAEFVKIVNNFMGFEATTTETSAFEDISGNEWFAPYVNAAFENGYIRGYGDGTFKPNELIRRQEVIVILARLVGIAEQPLSLEDPRGLVRYSDSAEVEEWARQAVNNYSAYGFVKGYGDGTLRILQNVTRAEVVELLNIVLEGI